MVRNNSQLNNSQSQALAENNSTFNTQNSTLRFALYICVMAPPAAPDTISSITRST